MVTTTKPSSASACLSPRAAVNARLPDAAGLRPGIRLVDDRILLLRIEVRRREQHAVDVRLAVGRLHLDRHRRLPAGREQLRDVGLLERHDELAVGVAQRHDRRRRPAASTCRRGTARRRELHGVRAVVGRQRDAALLAVEPDAVVVREVRILSLLAAVGAVPQRARLLVDARDLRDRPLAARDLVLQRAGRSDRRDTAGPSRRAANTRSLRWSSQRTCHPVRDSKCVFTFSSNTVRTAPVAASATRSTTSL